MKSQKLKLADLQVKSFVTQLDTKNILGGRKTNEGATGEADPNCSGQSQCTNALKNCHCGQ